MEIKKLKHLACVSCLCVVKSVIKNGKVIDLSSDHINCSKIYKFLITKLYIKNQFELTAQWFTSKSHATKSC